MNWLLLGARVVLSAVFAVAGLAKFVDLEGSRRAVREFGPASVAPLLGALLPVGELTIAVALIGQSSARWGAVGALLLLVVFIVAIGRAIVRGRTPDCHCFGQLHSAPAGWRTLVRNVVLAAMAAFVVAAGWTDAGASATGWTRRLSAGALVGIGVALIVVAGQAWFSWQLLRQHGRLLARLDMVEAKLGGQVKTAPEGLPIGTRAPPFALPSPDAGTVTLEHLLGHGRPVLLIFSDPACGPCAALLPVISQWQRTHGDRLTVAVISSGGGDALGAITDQNLIRHVGLQLDREVAEAYHVHGTPAAVLVDPDGRVASPLAAGRDAVVKLVEHGVSRAPHSSGAGRQPVSRPSPPLALVLLA